MDIATPAKRFHPNDDVNRSQSSNDAFPTVMHVATVEQMSNVLVPAAKELRDTLAAKAKEYDNVVMVGRTPLQDERGADFAARLSRGHRPQAALKLGYLSAEQFDQWVRPKDMTHPSVA